MLDLEDRIDMECTLIDVCHEDDTEIPKQRLVNIYSWLTWPDTCCFQNLSTLCSMRNSVCRDGLKQESSPSSWPQLWPNIFRHAVFEMMKAMIP